MKENLELAVSRVLEKDANVREAALQVLKHEIRTATSSMTSVPKPLKFLHPHYASMKDHYHTLNDSDGSKKVFADVLSVMAMTMAHGTRESLQFKVRQSKLIHLYSKY